MMHFRKWWKSVRKVPQRFFKDLSNAASLVLETVISGDILDPQHTEVHIWPHRVIGVRVGHHNGVVSRLTVSSMARISSASADQMLRNTFRERSQP